MAGIRGHELTILDENTILGPQNIGFPVSKGPIYGSTIIAEHLEHRYAKVRQVCTIHRSVSGERSASNGIQK